MTPQQSTATVDEHPYRGQDPCLFRRLYRRNQGSDWDRDSVSGEVTKKPQWEATDLLECPTCGRILRAPPEAGGGPTRICTHAPDWPDFRAQLYGGQVSPPLDSDGGAR